MRRIISELYGPEREIKQLPKLLIFNFARQKVLARLEVDNISSVMESTAGTNSYILSLIKGPD